MKVLKGALCALIAGGILLAAPALRADDSATPPDSQGDTHGADQHWDKFDGLKKRLGLTDDQVSQWKEVEKGQKDQAKLLRDKESADKANLVLLVDQKASDDALSAALKTLKSDRAAIEAQKAKTDDAIAGILSPTQQAKLLIAEGQWGKHGGFGRGHGGPGHGGPWQ
jgi:Spy/CpxP family protein refolding chaperone